MVKLIQINSGKNWHQCIACPFHKDPHHGRTKNDPCRRPLQGQVMLNLYPFEFRFERHICTIHKVNLALKLENETAYNLGMINPPSTMITEPVE